MSDTQIRCGICESNRHELVANDVYDAPESRVYRCVDCRVVYIHPIMSRDSEASFYEDEFPTYMESRQQPGGRTPEGHFLAMRPDADRRLRLVEPYVKPSWTILEIGSATGYFLDALAPLVQSVKGVEPGERFRDYASTRGIETAASVDEVEGPFDGIFLYYLVEHMRAPVEFLRSLQPLLAPEGRLFIEVPNVDDVLVSAYEAPAFGPFYWQRAHYFNYSPDTLKNVLSRGGYECETYPEQRYDLSNHIVWMTEGRPGGKGRFPFLRDADLETAYANCLKRAWLCDTVFAVAWIGT